MKLFNPVGTFVYGTASATYITMFLISGVTDWQPPLFVVLPAFLYIFFVTGTIFFGRMAHNEDAIFFKQALRKRGNATEVRNRIEQEDKTRHLN